METHNYVWKIGLQFSSNVTLRTNKPVTEDTVLIDLYDGHKYLVQTVYPATDREWPSTPEKVMQTWPIGSLTEDELSKIRDRAQYTPDELAGPLGDVVFFPA